jgi:hypothetical protein
MRRSHLGFAVLVSLFAFMLVDGSSSLLSAWDTRSGGYSSYIKDTTVRPYSRRDGTYVQPHHRKAPNSTQRDNYSSRGNTNPYTGRPGTREPKR